VASNSDVNRSTESSTSLKSTESTCSQPDSEVKAAIFRSVTPAVGYVFVLAELVCAAHQKGRAQDDELAQPGGQHGAGQRGTAGLHPAGEDLLGVGQDSVDVEVRSPCTRP
jgi:hypothetical protein